MTRFRGGALRSPQRLVRSRSQARAARLRGDRPSRHDRRRIERRSLHQRHSQTAKTATLRWEMISASPVESLVNHASPHALVLARQADADNLGETIAALAARLHAATYELLVLLREFDERSGWNNGFLSCAHWLHSTPTRTPRASGASALAYGYRPRCRARESARKTGSRCSSRFWRRTRAAARVVRRWRREDAEPVPQSSRRGRRFPRGERAREGLARCGRQRIRQEMRRSFPIVAWQFLPPENGAGEANDARSVGDDGATGDRLAGKPHASARGYVREGEGCAAPRSRNLSSTKWTGRIVSQGRGRTS